MRTKTETTARHTGKRTSAAEAPDIKLTVLDNGLTLIVREDHSAPVVSVQAWSQAGSIDEGKWLGAGMSHALEHMLFKGTSARPSGRIDQEVQDAGGYMNAYTSFDRTVYWINVPNTGATVAIDILCDIMQNATLPAAELEKEKQVILREMDMNQDDPGQRASRRLFETAYTRSPYRFTIIGYPDIFNELRREDLLAYYRQKYAPNNVIFLVVGDIQAAEAEKQIRAAFAGSKARPCPPEVLPEEPPQVASREVVEEAPIELGHFHFAWHIPDLRHPDMPALDVLAILLGSGRSSRLYQRVREQKGLVNSVDAWVYSPGNPGLFGMSAVVDADKVEAAKQAMLDELEQMKLRPVKASELAKAVRQFTSATLSSLKSMQGQAHDLGANWVAARDLHFSERYLGAVKKLKSADLQRVARRYLGEVTRTLYALLPNGTRQVAVSASTKSFENPIQLVELPNGLKLLLKEDHRLPFVEFRAVFQGGVLREGPTNNGSTLLLAKMMLQGTPKRSAEEIAREIESLGGSISSYGGNNSFGVNVEVLSSDFAKGIELLADAILNPIFPSGPLERERQVQLAEIKSQRDHLLSSAFRLMRAGLFGRVGYGLDVHGAEKTVRGLKASDLVRLHKTLVTPRNCVLAIFGDIKPAIVKAAATKLFRPWKPAAALAPPQSSSMELRDIVRVGDLREKKQAVLVIGFPGTTLMHEDRFALELLQESLSDLGSRLFTRIRDELGLAYYVGAQHFPGLVPGYFALYAGTEPAQADRVEKEMMQEVASLRESGLTAEELKRSKAKVLGQKKIARQDLGGLASTTALDELYGLGYSQNDIEDLKYEAVTLEQVRDVARKYLTPDRMVVSVIKPDPAANGSASPTGVRADEIEP